MVLAASRSARRNGAAVALVLAFTGCMTSKQDDCSVVGCTDEFRTVVVHVTDAAGNLITGLHPTSMIDGHPATVDQEGTAFDPGGYAVITDAELRLLTDTAEVTFEVSSPQGSASGVFQISTVPCHCHVIEVSGPSTLVVR
jgi:hypothetical protein